MENWIVSIAIKMVTYSTSLVQSLRANSQLLGPPLNLREHVLAELLSSQIYFYWSGGPMKDGKLPTWLIQSLTDRYFSYTTSSQNILYKKFRF